MLILGGDSGKMEDWALSFPSGHVNSALVGALNKDGDDENEYPVALTDLISSRLVSSRHVTARHDGTGKKCRNTKKV